MEDNKHFVFNYSGSKISPLEMSLLLQPRKESGDRNCHVTRTCKLSLTLQQDIALRLMIPYPLKHIVLSSSSRSSPFLAKLRH